MSSRNNERYAAATGILAVILIGVGFGIFAKNIPHADDSALKWQAFFVNHQDRIHTGLTIVGVGLFFFVWFLGSLRSAIAAAEGGTGRLASVAFAGGIIAVAFFLMAISGGAAAALHPQGVPPTVTRALNDYGAMAAAPAAAGFTALFAAAAIAGYRHGAFPAPIAGFAALAAITQPLAYGAATTDSGAWAPDGAVGFWIPLATFVIGMLALSGAMTARAGRETASPAAP